MRVATVLAWSLAVVLLVATVQAQGTATNATAGGAAAPPVVASSAAPASTASSGVAAVELTSASPTTVTPVTTTTTTTTTTATDASGAAATQASNSSDASPPRDPSQWGYGALGGDWSAGECGTVGGQSPINIIPANCGSGTDSAELDLDYPTVNAWRRKLTLRNERNALRIDGPLGALGEMKYNGRRYLVRGVEFHAPSEHHLDGASFDIEMQIVHQLEGASNDNELVVVSVLMDRAAPGTAAAKLGNPLLDSLDWASLPTVAGGVRQLTSVVSLLTASDHFGQGYYQYLGSGTQPPCKSAVTWMVLEHTQPVSAAQVAAINAAFRDNTTFAGGNGNNRQVLPIGDDRKVILHNHKARGDGDGEPIASDRDAIVTPPEAGRPPVFNLPSLAPEDAPDASAIAAASLGEAERRRALYAHGGADWGAMCRSGRHQSPINIVQYDGNPNGDWKMTSSFHQYNGATVANTGSAIEVDVGINFGQLVLNNRRVYYAQYLHFSNPSEHAIDGRRSSMEMQIVFQHFAKRGKKQVPVGAYAVLSVLFHESVDSAKNNEFLAQLDWNNLPSGTGERRAVESRLNANALFGLDDGYYSYAGSLSTPPCTEGVPRFVLRTYQEISTAQLNVIKRLFPNGSARNVQPSNRRGVRLYNVNAHMAVAPIARIIDDARVLQAL